MLADKSLKANYSILRRSFAKAVSFPPERQPE